MPPPSTAKTTEQIKRLINDGEFYSGHLKARSTVARLVGKSSEWDEKAQEAAALLFTAGSLLLQKGQQGSGADLALYLIEVWTQKKVACEDAQRSRICQMIALCGRSGTWRADIIQHAVSWSAKTGTCSAGDAQLHAYVGELLYKEKDYAAAEQHFVSAPSRDAAKLYAQMLYAWSLLDGHKTDGVGRYAARGVFSYLQNGCLMPAHAFLEAFLEKLLEAQPTLLVERTSLPSTLANSPGAPADFKLTSVASLNYLQLTVLNAQVGAGSPFAASTGTNVKGGGRQLWLQSGSRYEKDVTWLQAPGVKESREAVGQIWFGVKPAGRGGNDLMANLMGSLFGGGGGGGGASAGSGARGSIAQPGLD